MVQVVAKKLSTSTAAVTVIDPEERAGWPRFVLAVLRLDDVEDDGDSVLVVVAHQSLVRIRCVGPYNSVSLVRAFGRLVVRNYYPSPGS